MAAKFLIGSGPGVTWDNTNDTIWSTSSGGANNTTHPVAADTVTLDASSGGGVVTIGADLSMSTLTISAFTGTLDNSVNNKNITLATAFTNTGAGVRTLNLGSGTVFVTGGVGTVFSQGGATNLTFSGASATIDLTIAGALSSSRIFNGGTRSYGTVILNQTGTQLGTMDIAGAAGLTIGTLTVGSGVRWLRFASGVTTTITNAFNWNAAGSSTAPLLIQSTANGTTATISTASGSPTGNWAALADITCTGGATFAFTNSIDITHNSGCGITGPAGTGLSRARAFAGMA